jgi:hypothetical protein
VTSDPAFDEASFANDDGPESDVDTSEVGPVAHLPTWVSVLHGLVDLGTKPMWWALERIPHVKVPKLPFPARKR